MNLHVRCISNIKEKLVPFLRRLEWLGFTLQDKNILIKESFSRTINKPTNKKHDNILEYIKQSNNKAYLR
jgi:putative methionine-R-sulfoxide reductase with GAF domain